MSGAVDEPHDRSDGGRDGRADDVQARHRGLVVMVDGRGLVHGAQLRLQPGVQERQPGQVRPVAGGRDDVVGLQLAGRPVPGDQAEPDRVAGAAGTAVAERTAWLVRTGNWSSTRDAQPGRRRPGRARSGPGRSWSARAGAGTAPGAGSRTRSTSPSRGPDSGSRDPLRQRPVRVERHAVPAPPGSARATIWTSAPCSCSRAALSSADWPAPTTTTRWPANVAQVGVHRGVRAHGVRQVGQQPRAPGRSARRPRPRPRCAPGTVSPSARLTAKPSPVPARPR